MGLDLPASERGSTTVQDTRVAASVAAREPGTVVEPLEGARADAEATPGRLSRLVRRLPLVGRGEPEGRDTEDVANPDTETAARDSEQAQQPGVPGERDGDEDHSRSR